MFKELFSDTVSLIYPRTCCGCDSSLIRGEALICISCQVKLPRSQNHTHSSEKLRNKFAGKVDIQYAFACLIFVKQGLVQRLLYELKYSGITQIGELLGNWLGSEFLLSKQIQEIDIIVPIPLHKSRLRKRGFNQSEVFSNAFAKKLKIDHYSDILCRTQSTKTQTRKSRLARWINVSSAFNVNKKVLIQDKHILLIDDIITTGATFESAAITLLEHGAKKVSILAIAATK